MEARILVFLQRQVPGTRIVCPGSLGWMGYRDATVTIQATPVQPYCAPSRSRLIIPQGPGVGRECPIVQRKSSVGHLRGSCVLGILGKVLASLPCRVTPAGEHVPPCL